MKSNSVSLLGAALMAGAAAVFNPGGVARENVKPVMVQKWNDPKRLPKIKQKVHPKKRDRSEADVIALDLAAARRIRKGWSRAYVQRCCLAFNPLRAGRVCNDNYALWTC
jgi:hypothetical protein